MEICGKIPGDGGSCAWTLSGPDRDLSEEQWRSWEYSDDGQLCMTAASWATIKKLILEECIDNYGGCRKLKRKHKISHLGNHLEDMEVRVKRKSLNSD